MLPRPACPPTVRFAVLTTPGVQADEREIAAAVDGDVLQHLPFERVAALGALGLELGDAARDRDGLGERADFERHDAGVQFVVGVDDHVGALDGLEAFERDAKGVCAGLHLREGEVAGVLRGDRELVAALIVDECDGHAGDRAPLRVFHRSCDRAARRLRLRAPGCRQEYRKHEDLKSNQWMPHEFASQLFMARRVSVFTSGAHGSYALGGTATDRKKL